MNIETSQLMEQILDRLSIIENKIGNTNNSSSPIGDRLTWIEDQLDNKTELNRIWNKRFEFLEQNEKQLKRASEEMGVYIERHVAKLSEAYYHLFPDRLFPDEKIATQLTKILHRKADGTPKPDADPT